MRQETSSHPKRKNGKLASQDETKHLQSSLLVSKAHVVRYELQRAKEKPSLQLF